MKAKSLTCPKSPNCQTFLEEVTIQATTDLVLDTYATPAEITDIKAYRITHRTTNKRCAIHGCNVFSRLPF